MRLLLVTILIGTLIGLSSESVSQNISSGQSQSLLSGEQVLNIFIDSLGGAENLRRVKSIIMQVEAELGDQKFVATSYRVFPDKMKLVLQTPVEQSIRILNGQQGVISINGVLKEMDEDTKEGMLEQATIFPVLYQLENGLELINHGERVYDEGYYEVEITYPNGNKRISYYSIKTGLLYKTINSATGRTSYFLRYETKEGVKIPTQLRVRSREGQMILFLTRCEINPLIPDSEFELE